MCAITPLYAHVIDPRGLQEAYDRIAYARTRLPNDVAVSVVYELGLGDAIRENADGTQNYNLTHAQLVAVASALCWAAESGGRMQPSNEQ